MSLKLSGIDLRVLSVFLDVVEQEGFSAAAEARGASLSKVTRDIAAIEQRLGMRLCNRGRSGFSLTKEGEEIYRAARELMESVRSFETRIAATRTSLPQAVEIGIVDNMIANPECPVTACLNDLNARKPGQVISVNVCPISTMDLMVRDRRLDIGFSTKPGAPLAPLIYAPAFIERHALFVSRNCPEFEAFLRWTPGKDSELLPYVARAFPYEEYSRFEAGLPLRVLGVGNSLEAVLTAVVAGFGAGILPLHAARIFEHLVQLPYEGGCFEIPFNAIIRRDVSERGPAAEIFQDLRARGRNTAQKVQA